MVSDKGRTAFEMDDGQTLLSDGPRARRDNATSDATSGDHERQRRGRLKVQ
jgi:hypothetical protein